MCHPNQNLERECGCCFQNFDANSTKGTVTRDHKIIDERIEKSIKGIRIGHNLHQRVSTHRPHMYPTPGRAWGMGVVGGCARAVPAQPPSPLTPLLHNSSLRQFYFEKTMTQALYYIYLTWKQSWVERKLFNYFFPISFSTFPYNSKFQPFCLKANFSVCGSELGTRLFFASPRHQLRVVR